MNSKRVILITGTRKGIGKALAEYYSGCGYQVIGCSRSEPEWHLDNYQHYLADVSDEDSVKKIFSSVRKDFGKLDCLINNAGRASMNHSLFTSSQTIEEILAVNVAGTFLFCREAARLMKREGFGRIVNFTSVAVPLRIEGEAIYGASKAAVLNLTRVLAREYAEWGITVNAVGPNPVDTDLTKNVPKDKIEALIEAQAIKRMGTFADIFNVIDFYLHEQSGFITGQVLFLGGV
jgi:3-oxoacyl-[acyl-carrier protein] reductase